MIDAATSRRPVVSTGRGGLRVVSEPVPGVRSVAIGVWIGVGSRFERAEEAGISHFLEHMLFKGTPTLSPEEIAQVFDGLGGEVNAATGKDYTVLYCRVLDELVDRAMPVLTDMLQRPTLADLDQEREVVLEEIAMYEDDPQDQIHDLASVAVFPDQALGRPVIGTAQVIGSVPADGVRAYHERPLHGAQHRRRGGRQHHARARRRARRRAARATCRGSPAPGSTRPPGPDRRRSS